MRRSLVALSSRAFSGRQWIGKDRKIWKYSQTRKQNTMKYFDRVANNHVILSNPYITHEQEFAYTQRINTMAKASSKKA
ncbi:hypothetical protein PTSG_03686 [Salpingoeca rosetta]|uniref:Uncharacterized protein n=1 Tax=Salpingoeca rosetta (strain ATCC 50818 / BSB-021) TaxID=946362 RepID=F2U6A7_SALR5|nr:uncharacterized protein PTSG_03686 [Salpingoeca rosetta]EGD83048.1 hypothetical protein PTSG_03686 [Salpingoeca rosetta]|eukprot:XP_004995412.1 hypothetical protein PTSG_03686 [Salpingoeca rosetta]